MKNLVLLGILIALITGCATQSSLQTKAGKFLTSTAVTVDAAMKGWATYVVLHNTPQEQQTGVRNAYATYQAAMMVATNAYTQAAVAKDMTLFSGASNNLVVAKTILVQQASTK